MTDETNALLHTLQMVAYSDLFTTLRHLRGYSIPPPGDCPSPHPVDEMFNGWTYHGRYGIAAGHRGLLHTVREA